MKTTKLKTQPRTEVSSLCHIFEGASSTLRVLSHLGSLKMNSGPFAVWCESCKSNPDADRTTGLRALEELQEQMPSSYFVVLCAFPMHHKCQKLLLEAKLQICISQLYKYLGALISLAFLTGLRLGSLAICALITKAVL